MSSKTTFGILMNCIGVKIDRQFDDILYKWNLNHKRIICGHDRDCVLCLSGHLVPHDLLFLSDSFHGLY